MIILESNKNITTQEWLDQAIEFRNEQDVSTVHNLPKKTDFPGIAEIQVHFHEPLFINGFYATITYVQHYFEQINAAQPDGSVQIVQNPTQEMILKYKKEISRENVNTILEQIDPMIPAELKYLDRDEAKYIEAIVQDIVQKQILGLNREDWNVRVVRRDS